jgi:hypothetical protein
MIRSTAPALLAWALVSAGVRGQEAALPGVPTADPPVNKQQIEAALKLTTEAAAKYAFTFQDADSQPARLHSEPILRWSNPQAGEIYGNVFLWTIDDRPAAVGSLFKWFTPHTHMSHEFHSLAEAPLAGTFEGRAVWRTSQPGLAFVSLPGAPPPADSAVQRLLAMKRLAKDFTATKISRDDSKQELRLLTQPIYRYAVLEQQILDGALFVHVQGTDPEVFSRRAASAAPNPGTLPPRA